LSCRSSRPRGSSKAPALERVYNKGLTLVYRVTDCSRTFAACSARKARSFSLSSGRFPARTATARRAALVAPAAGRVLTRHHRLGEWVEAGDPVVTLQVEEPYLRAEVPEERLSAFAVGGRLAAWPQARPTDRFSVRVVSVKPRSEYATRKNWGLQDRDLKTFSVRLAPQGKAVIAGQTFVVEAGRAN